MTLSQKTIHAVVRERFQSRPPLKFKVTPSVGKIIATIFWDSEGILLIDYLPPKKTMKGPYYAELIQQLKVITGTKRRRKLTRKVLLLHDNAPVHTSTVSQPAIRDCGFEMLDHPPYSPDLAPCGFFLFPNLKKELRGKRFNTDEDVKNAIFDHFSELDKSYFLEGLRGLLKRMVVFNCFAFIGFKKKRELCAPKRRLC